MNRRFAILIGAVLLGGASLAVPWPRTETPRSLSQELTLVKMVQVSGLDLPVEWFSLRQYEENDPAGLESLEGFEPIGRRLAEDALGVSQEKMRATLDALPDAVPGSSIRVPGDSGLCLHWDSSVGLLEPRNRAQDFALTSAARNQAKTLGWEENPPPAPGGPPGIPASRTAPPLTWRIAAATAELEKLPGRRSSLSGLGLLEVRSTGGSRFWAAGTPRAGGNPAVVAWLHVGEDDEGGLWFWFEELPAR